MSVRIDRISLARFDEVIEADTGYLRISGIASQVGVLEYGLADGMDEDGVFEFVPPETVASAVDSLIGKPITNDHPPVMLTAENTSEYQVGVIVGVQIEGDGDSTILRIDALITDAETIKDIQAGKKELSPGYHTKVDDAPGIWHGQRFDGIQGPRQYNHLAIVDLARAGDTNRFDQLKEVYRCDGIKFQKGGAMTVEKDKKTKKDASDDENLDEGMVKLKIGDKEFTVAKEVADAFAAKSKSDEDHDEDDKKDEGDEDDKKDEGDEDDMKDKTDNLSKAQVVQAEALFNRILDKRDSAVKAESFRLDAVNRVRGSLAESYDFEGKKPAQMYFDAITELSKPAAKDAREHRDCANTLKGIFIGLKNSEKRDANQNGKTTKLDSKDEEDTIEAARKRQDARKQNKPAKKEVA